MKTRGIQRIGRADERFLQPSNSRGAAMYTLLRQQLFWNVIAVLLFVLLVIPIDPSVGCAGDEQPCDESMSGL